MWPDNDTDQDFLNFSGVAETVAEIIVSAQGRPISIGVSGAWGVGKSSLIKLTKTSLAQRSPQAGQREFGSVRVRSEINNRAFSLLEKAYDGALE